MDTPVFSHIPANGLTSLSADLETDAWGAIDTAPWEGPDRTAAKPLGDAPVTVAHKLRLKWSIATLLIATAGAGSAKDCDRAWDSVQKQLQSLIAAGASSSDPAKREAAGRLAKALLSGAGTAQTKLSYQQEVDFGRTQLAYTAKGQGAADVTLLGLGATMTEVQQTTDALAATIGHGQSAGRPFERLAEATAACAASFAVVAEALAWEAKHGQAGGDRERAVHLRAPLEKLAARYPVPAKVGAKGPEGGEAPQGNGGAPGGG